FVELLVLQFAGGTAASAVGHERALALAGHDHDFLLQFQVGALDRDYAHLQRRGKRPDRRQLATGLTVPGGDACADLLHDLQIHGAGIGLGDVQVGVHTVYTVYAQYGGIGKCRWNRTGSSGAGAAGRSSGAEAKGAGASPGGGCRGFARKHRKKRRMVGASPCLCVETGPSEGASVLESTTCLKWPLSPQRDGQPLLPNEPVEESR